MMKIQALVVSAALAIGMAAPASAAQTDPEVIVYRFPGVYDDGSGSGVGFATMFNCTNFSGANENIRFVTRNFNSSITGNMVLTIAHLNSQRALTHTTVLGGQIISSGTVDGGTTAVAATSTNIICTAATIDAANPKGDGLSLRGIRFNPAPGSQE